jgi:hypothetical protein
LYKTVERKNSKSEKNITTKYLIDKLTMAVKTITFRNCCYQMDSSFGIAVIIFLTGRDSWLPLLKFLRVLNEASCRHSTQFQSQIQYNQRDDNETFSRVTDKNIDAKEKDFKGKENDRKLQDPKF